MSRLVVALLIAPTVAAFKSGWYPPLSGGATQYLPYFDDPPMIAIEAENMTVAKGDWLAGDWGHAPTRFAATVANTFMSRRSCLHAPATVGAESVATATFKVATAASYNVLLRYEAAYLFETPVLLEIRPSSGGRPVFSKIYGLRHSLKVQGFGKARLLNATEYSKSGSMCGQGRIPTDGLQAECIWPYGATENWVWEGVGAMAQLEAGEYTIAMTGVNTTTGDNGTPKDLVAFAERNIDAILLTTNSSDVKKRLWYASDALALDGYLSQAGEVFFRVTNLDSQNNLTLTVPRVYGHSYYFTMHTSLPIPTPDGGLTAGCQFTGGPRCGSIYVDKGGTSEWVDVGMYMDVFNHGTWNFGPGSRAGMVDVGMYMIQVGVKTKPGQAEPEPIGPRFVSSGEGVQIVFDASTRATKRVRSEASDFFELSEALDLQTTSMVPNRFGVKGSRMTATRRQWDLGVQVYGTFWPRTPSGGGFASTSCPRCGQEYSKAWAVMNDMFGIQANGFWGGACTDGSTNCEWDSANQKAYLDLRAFIKDPATLQAQIDVVRNVTDPDNLYVISLGDEIAVTAPDPTATSSANFTKYCEEQNVSVADGCGGGNATVSIAEAAGDKLSNGRYYHSQKFIHHRAIQHFKNMTSMIQKGFPNAGIGANFAPTVYKIDPRDKQQYCLNYLGETFQWLSLFREGGATLPWSEDWAWQTPIGSQQMVTQLIDLMRSSVTKHASFDKVNPYSHDAVAKQEREYSPVPLPPVDAVTGSPPMMMYVMPHFVGNSPASWRRQFYGDFAHGVKIIDLFQMVTSISGYTCDYTDQDGGTYQEIRTALNELTMFDDIIVSGSAQFNLARVALMYSETADIWYSPLFTPGAAKRTLYLALRHAQLPVDMVSEDDCIAGALNHYSVLYIVDHQVSEAAMGAVAAWVSIGGRLVVTAGGAQLNEYNKTNTATEELLLVKQHGIWTGMRQSRHNATIFLEKQELPFAETLDEATATPAAESPRMGNLPPPTMGVFGEKSVFTFSGPTHDVLATFKDGSPAQVAATKGKGSATYIGFHPGLAYMQPALPRRPVDRTPDLNGYTHFVPTEFNLAVRTLLLQLVDGVPDARPIVVSNPLVEVGYVTSAAGTALPLVNWATKGNQTAYFDRENFTRVEISLAGLTPPPVFTNATLASCGSLDNVSCAALFPGKLAPLNVSEDKLTLTVDVAIADCIILR